MPHQAILEFSMPGRGTRDIADAVASVVRESRVQCAACNAAAARQAAAHTRHA